MIGSIQVIKPQTEVQDLATRISNLGGSMSASETNALNSLVQTWKQHGIWSYLKDIGVFVGGYQGTLEKLKTHPSITGGYTNLIIAGVTLSSVEVASSILFLRSGGSLKTRVKLSALPFNDFLFTQVRPFNQSLPAQGPTFGAAESSNYDYSLGYRGYYFTPRTDLSVSLPWTTLDRSGIFTISHAPTTGTAYNNYQYRNEEEVGNQLEDIGSTVGWVDGTKDIECLELPDSYLSLYVIGAGLPLNLLKIYQASLVKYHQDLITPVTNVNIISVNKLTRILCWGDSLTVGLSSSATEYYPYSVMLNASAAFIGNISATGYRVGGASGSTNWNYSVFTTGFRHFDKGYCLGSGLNIMVVWLGTNDLLQGYTPAETKATMDSFCASWRALGWSILLLDCFPSTTYAGGGATSFNANVGTYNSLLHNDVRYSNGVLASGIVRISEVPQFQDSSNSTYFYDGLHLEQAGYKIVANYVSVAIANIFIGADTNTEKLPNALLSDGFLGINGSLITKPEIGPDYITVAGDWEYYNLGMRPKPIFTTNTLQENAKVINIGANSTVAFRVTKHNRYIVHCAAYFRYIDSNNWIRVRYAQFLSEYVFTAYVEINMNANYSIVRTFNNVGTYNSDSNFFQCGLNGNNITLIADGVTFTHTITQDVSAVASSIQSGLVVYICSPDHGGAANNYTSGAYCTDPLVSFDNLSISL
jgi:lysophospholipase L1-like esterase